LNEIYKARELRHDLRIFAFKSQISDYQNNVTRLNKELVELEENESKIYILILNKYVLNKLILESVPIKFGEKFGGIDGIHFLDSLIPNLTYYHYFSEIIVSHDEKIYKVQGQIRNTLQTEGDYST
jgi:hypothetical protein